MGEWLLSPRDRLISAWIPRPEGTVEVIVSPVVSPKDFGRRNRVYAA
jgi:hypothetical protein